MKDTTTIIIEVKQLQYISFILFCYQTLRVVLLKRSPVLAFVMSFPSFPITAVIMKELSFLITAVIGKEINDITNASTGGKSRRTKASTGDRFKSTALRIGMENHIFQTEDEYTFKKNPGLIISTNKKKILEIRTVEKHNTVYFFLHYSTIQ